MSTNPPKKRIPPEPEPGRKTTDGSFLAKLRNLSPDPAFVVLCAFVLLQISRLIDMLITSKTVENVFVIPFQVIIFSVPILLYAMWKAPSDPHAFARSFRVKRVRLHQLPLILSAVLLILCGTVTISLIFAGTESLHDGFTLYNTFISQNNGGFFKTLFLMIAYAVVPAFFEELTFRGFLCREYEKYNVAAGIVASSFFFALLHFDLPLLPVYFFSGIVLALLMYATGSTTAAMIAHCIFNLFGLFGQPFLNSFYTITGGSAGLFIFIVCMLGILAAALFCTFASKCYERRAEKTDIPPRRILPKPEKITRIASDIFINPFAVSAVVFYIVVIAISNIF